eukprot:TRINITY_DN7342_c0_g1_i7.p1 TRINITY_DN7342_c0_g1~~TRINITY_DN7342_c0_g1_i7.p1  ORF type:complete len:549 (+),score=126.01 TRINITY_DN7342_c0_g1_i7:125-1648(+)
MRGGWAALLGSAALLLWAHRWRRGRRAAFSVPAAERAAAAPRSAAPARAPHRRGPWGLLWAEGNRTANCSGALRRAVPKMHGDASQVMAHMIALVGLPGLLAASRPLRIFRDKATGLTMALGMMAHTITPRLCGALYQLLAMGWPVNIVGPILEGLRGRDFPVRSLRNRPDLASLRHDMPVHLRGAIRKQLDANWMLRKHFIYADMAALAPPDTLLLLVDAGDVYAQMPPSAFAAAWLDWEQQRGRGTVAHGAEYGCYPFDEINRMPFGCGRAWEASWNLSQSPCRFTPDGRGVNTGLLAGRARDLDAYWAAFVDFVVAVPRVCYVPDDQAISFLLYLNTRGVLSCRGCARERSRRVRPVIDVNETLFACLVWVTGGWLSPEYVRTGSTPGAPFAAPGARRPPSLMHFAGTPGKIQLKAKGGKLGSEAGLWGYWGVLAEGSAAEAERTAARTAESELAVDGARAKLGGYCSPPAAGRPPRVLQGWEAPSPAVELPSVRRAAVRVKRR